ncbi:MAG: selenide, water dikinase SelD, partial [Thermoanaerobaculia bacterium]|nr:selenide, water dikinase SelD [Thermoanaerobaculia bacterium]
MSPVGLAELLGGLPKSVDPNLLVGFETNDDAAVYRLDDGTAVVTTADIITPPVDDPRVFGRIAAANSLSDLYAMGARPIVCLNLICFPQKKLGPEILAGIVAGALETIGEAGAVLAGGHSTEDEEPKFGLVAVGLVDPSRVWRNTGAQAGDVLLLTKPLGSGVLFNANRKGWVSDQAMAACIDTLTTLNRAAAEALAPFDPHAVTDVTGFGLAGHADEVARGSGVTLRISIADLPVMDEALAMYRRGMSTGVNRVNRELIESVAHFDHDLPDWHEEIVVDPQTSGGLLVAVDPERAEEIEDALRRAAVRAVRIGEVLPRED